MPRAGLTPDRVADQAEAITEEAGIDGLSLVAVAERLGVRVPSLYKHIEGLGALRVTLATRAKVGLADALSEAVLGTDGEDPIRILARTYRAWAKSHPGTYPLTLRGAIEGDVDDERASARLAAIVSEVLALSDAAPGRAIDDTRAVRAALHGFVALENAGGFGLPRSVDVSFDRLIDGVVLALRHPRGSD